MNCELCKGKNMREEYSFIANLIDSDGRGTIIFPNPPLINDGRYARWMRDIERMQWFADRNGYTQEATQWIGHYQSEEYNCVVRYLLRFGWTQIS